MKKTLVVLTSVLSVACGSDGKVGNPGSKGEQGSPGSKGEQGLLGSKGMDGTYFPAGTLSSVLDQSKSVLDIECVSNGSRGTGSKLQNGNVLTAFHVVDGCTSIQFWSGSQLVGLGGSYAQDSVRDIARVSLVNWNSVGVTVKGLTEYKDYSPLVGDLTITASLPLDLIHDVQIATGHVTNITWSGTSGTDGYVWNNMFLNDSAGAAGSSGAPVFDSLGRLIGILVGGYSRGGLPLHYNILLR